MDILLQFQSTRKQKSLFVKVEGVPFASLARFLRDFNYNNFFIHTVPMLEDRLNDTLCLCGFLDALFCNRKVILTISYSDFTGITHRGVTTRKTFG